MWKRLKPDFDNEPRRALRGGSWVSKAAFARLASRSGGLHSFDYVFLGFRLAYDIDFGGDKWTNKN